MTPADLDASGRALYDACPSVKPTWDQLGAVTKSVWMERVTEAPAKVEAPKPAGHMDSLF